LIYRLVIILPIVIHLKLKRFQNKFIRKDGKVKQILFNVFIPINEYDIFIKKETWRVLNET